MDNLAIASTQEGLVKTFGDIRAVNGISLDIPIGAIFGLLGPDGAGKSTLIRLFATVLTPDAGDTEIFGLSLRNKPNLITPFLGYMPQKFSMYPDLTVAENVNFFAQIRGVSKSDRAERSARLLSQMGLSNFSKRRATRLSGGMKQKLMLASLLMHEPDLLLLDEPTTGVDPVSRQEFWDVINRLQSDGKTTLAATPYMDEAERCTHVAFIDDGVITHFGTPAQIKAQVPGVLIEVKSANVRLTSLALENLDTFIDNHILGDVVRVLVPNKEVGIQQIRGLLEYADIPYEVDVIEMDMESTFAALTEAEQMKPKVNSHVQEDKFFMPNNPQYSWPLWTKATAHD